MSTSTWALCASLSLSLAAQDPAATPAVQDLAGKVEGVAKGETVRVTVWKYDMNRDAVDPLADGKADAEGVFRFKAVPWLREHDWGFNTTVVVAKAGDRAIGLLEVRGDHVDCSKLAVALAPAVAIAGVVVSGGKPVAGARVWPWAFKKPVPKKELGMRERGWDTLVGPLAIWRAETDAKGAFAIKGVPEGMGALLTVRHRDHAEGRLEVADAKVKCEVELVPGGVIQGVVRLPDGKPAVRATVSVQGHRAFFGQTQTDDAGHYEVRCLPEGPFNVWAESDEFTVVALHGVQVQAGETVKGQDLALVRGGFVVGVVLDEATGKPVKPGKSADVAMYGPARPNETGCQCVPLKADGTFRIRAPAGMNYVYLRAGDGWVATTGDGKFDVVEGQETKVEFQCKRGREAEPK
jgi:hypothetical protein